MFLQQSRARANRLGHPLWAWAKSLALVFFVCIRHAASSLVIYSEHSDSFAAKFPFCGAGFAALSREVLPGSSEGCRDIESLSKNWYRIFA